MLLLLLLGCAKPHVEATRAFYFWRTTFTLTPRERALLTSTRTTRLYLRLFDVTWNARAARAEPVGRLVFTDDVPAGLDVVPVVFLRNEVFTHEPDVVALADRVLAAVRAQNLVFHELQLDCDWTESTRDAFFTFCQRLREQLDGKTLSATIRLHQVKYAQRTGVPPVERGMLMFYNLGRLAPDAERSSIFNSQDAARYVAKLDDYPLPLDAALPVFSWAVQARGDRVIDLLSKPDLHELEAQPALTRTDARHFRAQAAAAVAGGYVQPGDTLTLEVMTPDTAREAATLLARHLHPRAPFTISLFDLDERNLHDWAPADLDPLFDAVR